MMCLFGISFASAVLDGVFDGCICSSPESRYYRYVCEMARGASSLAIGTLALMGSWELQDVALVCAVSWVGAAFSTRSSPLIQSSETEGSPTWKSSFPIILTLIAVMAPRCDMFVFRQKVLGMSPQKQTFVALTSTVARVFGVSVYQWLLAPLPQRRRVPLAFALWTLPSFFWLCILYNPSLAAAESAVHEIGSSITFMECNIIMQEFAARAGPLAGTTFATYQAIGSLGYWIGRNNDFWALHAFGVDEGDLKNSLLPFTLFCIATRVACTIASGWIAASVKDNNS